MARHNTMFLVVAGSIAGEFENFGSKVFENSGEINCAEST
jgi:hypothetical protein